MSPDVLGNDASDPQSFNRFNYTRGDPTNLIDPLGLHYRIVCGWHRNDQWEDSPEPGYEPDIHKVSYTVVCEWVWESADAAEGPGDQGSTQVQPNYSEVKLQGCLHDADNAFAPKVTKVRSELSVKGAVKSAIFGIFGYALGGPGLFGKVLDSALLSGASQQYDLFGQLAEFSSARAEYFKQQQSCQNQFGFYRVPVNVLTRR